MLQSPAAAPVYVRTDISPPEKELVAATHDFVAFLNCGLALEQAASIVSDEMERARQSAEKSRRQALRRSQLNQAEVRP
jgi:hypothetical protein